MGWLWPPIHFDNRGKARYGDGTRECGPYYIDEGMNREVVKQTLDPSQLRVGRSIRLCSGSYGCEAKVLEITPTGIIVEQPQYPGKKFRLNAQGVAVDSRDLGWNDSRIYNDALPIPGTFENGPWMLEGSEAEKRTHVISDEMMDYIKSLGPPSSLPGKSLELEFACKYAVWLGRSEDNKNEPEPTPRNGSACVNAAAIRTALQTIHYSRRHL